MIKEQKMINTSELYYDGWKQEEPANKESVRVDKAMVSRMRCPRCNCRHGLAYVPFTRGREYKAFAVCRTCGYELEF